MKNCLYIIVIFAIWPHGNVYAKNPEAVIDFDWNASRVKKEPLQFVLSENVPLLIRGVIPPEKIGLANGNGFYAPIATGEPLVDLISVPVQLLANWSVIKVQQNSHLSKLTKESIEFGDPYTKLLDGVTKKELLAHSIAMIPDIVDSTILETDHKDSGAVKLLYDFSITDDHKAIILDTVFQTNKAEKTPHSDLNIKIISTPKQDLESINDWIEKAYDIKSEITELLAESIRILLLFKDIENDFTSYRERSIRYHEGGKVRFERALVLGEYCGRILMRNLRGIYFSVPSSNPADFRKDKCLDLHNPTFVF